MPKMKLLGLEMPAITVYHGKILYFKGTVSRNVWLQVLFHGSSSPQAPDFPTSEVFEFVRKFAKIFTNQGAPPVARKNV
jgi:hypothetical protein